jgi:hypothetical protein
VERHAPDEIPNTNSSAMLLLALAPAILFALLLYALFNIGLPWTFAWPWIPSLGIAFSVRVYGLAAQFLLLITGVGTLVFIYGRGLPRKRHDRYGSQRSPHRAVCVLGAKQPHLDASAHGGRELLGQHQTMPVPTVSRVSSFSAR